MVSVQAEKQYRTAVYDNNKHYKTLLIKVSLAYAQILFTSSYNSFISKSFIHLKCFLGH